MKKIMSAIVILSMLIGIIIPMQAVAETTNEIFSDNFESGLSEKWYTSGTLTSDDLQINAENSNHFLTINGSEKDAGLAMISLADTDTNNYVMTAKMRLEIGDEMDLYMRSGGQYGYMRFQLATYKISRCIPWDWSNLRDTGIEKNIWYNVAVIASEGKYQYYLNDEFLGEYDRSDLDYTVMGKDCGFFSWFSTFSIDDVKITKYNVAENETMPENSNYRVEIKKGSSNFETLFVHNAKVYWAINQIGFSEVVYDFSEPLTVRVTKLNSDFEKVDIRPYSYGIDHTVINQNTVEFTLTEPRKISIEFDGDKMNNLFLFADLPDENKPNESDQNVIYYGPGVHNVGEIELKSNQTLYLDEGALVYGYITATGATNIAVRGRGIIDGAKTSHDTSKPRKSQLCLTNCDGVTIEGIIMRDTATWNVVTFGCKNVHVNGIKQIGSNGNSDGFDICNSSDVLIENTFQRNNDDNISVKAYEPADVANTDGGATANVSEFLETQSKRITMRNCVLWADAAHNMLIGPEMRGKTASDITFENIDVLYNTQNDDVYSGVMAMMIADKGVYQNITWKNIRVEDIVKGKIISLSYQNAYAPMGYGLSAEHIKFENISYIGENASSSRIIGKSETETINDVTIKNFRINGVEVTDPTSANIVTNDYANNINFYSACSDNIDNVPITVKNSSIDCITNVDNQLSYLNFAQKATYVDPLSGIQITSLPKNGSLLLHGIPVLTNQIISAAEIPNIIYRSNVSETDTIAFKGECNGVFSDNTAILTINNKDVRLNGKCDFMTRDNNGNILYSDGTIAPNAAEMLSNDKVIMFDSSKILEQSNLSLFNGPGWKIKQETVNNLYCHLQRETTSDGYAVFGVNSNQVFSMELLGISGLNNLKSSIEILGSADNKTYTAIDYTLENMNLKSPNNYYSYYTASTDILPSEYKYIKVVLKNGADNLPPWAPQILSVSAQKPEPLKITFPSSFQVFQRNSNNKASFGITGSVQHINAAYIKAEIGGQVLKEPINNNSFSISANDIDVGIYDIITTLYDENDTVLVTDLIKDVCVGDIWIAMGQSNMAGNGLKINGYTDNVPVRGVNQISGYSGFWEQSKDYGEANAPDKTSPVMEFGKQLYEKTGVPIGIVQSAVGGTWMLEWLPEADGGKGRLLYDRMLSLLTEKKATGVIWYQGCNDHNGIEAPDYNLEKYAERFTKMVNNLRHDFNNPNLPIITAQLNKHNDTNTIEEWARLKNIQRKLASEISNTAIVVTNDLEMSDGIHNSAASNLIVGRRMASCALAMAYGKDIQYKAPEINSAAYKDNTVIITFDNVTQFTATNDITEFEVTDKTGLLNIIKAEILSNNAIKLTLNRNASGDVKISGINKKMFQTNLYDNTSGMPILTFTDEASVSAGDVDGNGRIDVKDLVRFKKYFAGTGQNCIKAALYTDGDNKIDAADIVALKRRLLSII